MKIIKSRKDNSKVKVHRTREGLVFELITIFMLVILWAIAFLLYLNVPLEIPIHFDISGTPNAMGNRVQLLIMAGIGTIVSLLLLVSAYFPNKMVNMPFAITNVRQYVPIVRMTRVLAVELAMLFISVILLMGVSDKSPLLWIFYTTIMVLLIVTVIFYSGKAYQLK